MIRLDWSDVVGTCGVVCFLLAYWLLQRGRTPHTSLLYLGLNLAGAVLVMLSLLADWNLPAFLLEAAWAMISIAGIYIHVYPGKRNRPHVSDQ